MCWDINLTCKERNVYTCVMQAIKEFYFWLLKISINQLLFFFLFTDMSQTMTSEQLAKVNAMLKAQLSQRNSGMAHRLQYTKKL